MCDEPDCGRIDIPKVVISISTDLLPCGNPASVSAAATLTIYNVPAQILAPLGDAVAAINEHAGTSATWTPDADPSTNRAGYLTISETAEAGRSVTIDPIPIWELPLVMRLQIRLSLSLSGNIDGLTVGLTFDFCIVSLVAAFTAEFCGAHVPSCDGTNADHRAWCSALGDMNLAAMIGNPPINLFPTAPLVSFGNACGGSETEATDVPPPPSPSEATDADVPPPPPPSTDADVPPPPPPSEDVDQDQNQAQAQAATTASSAQPGLDGGAIFGIVFGSLIFLCLVAFLGTALWTRKFPPDQCWPVVQAFEKQKERCSERWANANFKEAFEKQKERCSERWANANFKEAFEKQKERCSERWKNVKDGVNQRLSKRSEVTLEVDHDATSVVLGDLPDSTENGEETGNFKSQKL